MAKRKAKSANPMQAALDEAGHTATVDAFDMGDDGLTCTVMVDGVAHYERVQRHDRTDEELLATAVSAFPRLTHKDDGQ